MSEELEWDRRICFGHETSFFFPFFCLLLRSGARVVREVQEVQGVQGLGDWGCLGVSGGVWG